jgi:hypothetical protein
MLFEQVKFHLSQVSLDFLHTNTLDGYSPILDKHAIIYPHIHEIINTFFYKRLDNLNAIQ